MQTTSGTRRACISCRYYPASSRVIGPFGQVTWADGETGRCQNRRSATWNVRKQPLMNCAAWEGLTGD